LVAVGLQLLVQDLIRSLTAFRLWEAAQEVETQPSPLPRMVRLEADRTPPLASFQ
jgi:hypothetical protein